MKKSLEQWYEEYQKIPTAKDGSKEHTAECEFRRELWEEGIETIFWRYNSSRRKGIDKLVLYQTNDTENIRKILRSMKKLGIDEFYYSEPYDNVIEDIKLFYENGYHIVRFEKINSTYYQTENPPQELAILFKRSYTDVDKLRLLTFYVQAIEDKIPWDKNLIEKTLSTMGFENIVDSVKYLEEELPGNLQYMANILFNYGEDNLFKDLGLIKDENSKRD